MKKILAIALSMLMTASMLTACGEKDDDKDEKETKATTTTTTAAAEDDKPAEDDNPTEDVDIEVSLGTDAAAPLGETVGDEIEISEDIFSGLKDFEGATEYTMDINASTSVEGMTMEIPMLMSTDGKNTYVCTSVFGINMEVLSLDGKDYMLDQANKVYYATEDASLSTDEMTPEEFTSILDGAVKANKVTIEGVEFDRVEYSTDDMSGFAYFKNGMIKYMAAVADGENMLMVVDRFEAKADASLLSLPADYKEVTEDEYMELVYGDLSGDMEMEME